MEREQLWWHKGSDKPDEQRAIRDAFKGEGVTFDLPDEDYGPDQILCGVRGGRFVCVTDKDLSQVVTTVGVELPTLTILSHKRFKAFEKVLVRLNLIGKSVWMADFYSYFDGTNHHTISHGRLNDNQILSYEGNEDLLGKEKNVDSLCDIY